MIVHRRPVIVLGSALYALPGLIFQGSLDAFWHASPNTRPDWQLWQAFRHVITTRTQVNGGVHSAAGIKLAVEGAVDRLLTAARRPPYHQSAPSRKN